MMTLPPLLIHLFSPRDQWMHPPSQQQCRPYSLVFYGPFHSVTLAKAWLRRLSTPQRVLQSDFLPRQTFYEKKTSKQQYPRNAQSHLMWLLRMRPGPHAKRTKPEFRRGHSNLNVFKFAEAEPSGAKVKPHRGDCVALHLPRQGHLRKLQRLFAITMTRIPKTS